MPAGHLQLSYTGTQDVILTGKPQYSFFKCVFKRYLNFSVEPIRQVINGECNFGKTVSIKIKKAGDLLSKTYIVLKLPALTANSGTYAGWANSIGNLVVSRSELYIGGNKIDTIYYDSTELKDEFFTSESKRISKNLMIGRFEEVTALQTNATSETIYNIPLEFYFSRHLPLAIPLINLQYHEIEIKLTFRDFSECITFDGATGPSEVSFVSCDLWADYVFFDDSVRANMAKSSPNFLIEQTQRSVVSNIPTGVSTFRKEIKFNHPVKYLMWYYREVNSETNNDWFNFSARSDGGKIATSTVIQVDSNELFDERDESYFRLVQPYEHFTRTPLKYVYCYSFAKNPEDYQPSGTFNFSKVDSSYINSQIRSSVSTSCNCVVIAINYNVLVFRNGMAALLWSS